MNSHRLLVTAAVIGLGAATTSLAVGPADDVRATIVGQVASTDLAPEVQAFVSEKLAPLMTNQVFVSEVAKQNGKNRPLSEIQQMCAEWSAAEEELPIMREMLSNAVANEIRKVCGTMPQVGEVFVMDNQGANAGQNALTSDFWQGDEAKWKKSFNEGKGGVDVGKASLDKSTNEVLQQVSLPLINEQGEVIGAICFGLRINQF
jgi:hypothetical protein